MPGVLQLEAIAQVAGILMLKKAENIGKLAYFMAAENVKWRKPVLPGDILTIDVELTKSAAKSARLSVNVRWTVRRLAKRRNLHVDRREA